jgi:hypothetical protein
MKYLNLIYIILVLLFFNYCSNQQEKSLNEKKKIKSDNKMNNLTEAIIPFTKLTEEQKLNLIKFIKIGYSYEEVKQIINNLSDLRRESRRSELYDATAPINIFNNSGIIEFNFKSNILYSYCYQVYGLSHNTADSLYLFLQQFYSKEYGKYLEEKDPGNSSYSGISSYWEKEYFTIVMTKNMYPKNCKIGLCFQKPY